MVANKQEFVPGLVNAVKEYYMPHRDTMLHLVRFVCDAEGEQMILVRFCDERGIRRSALVSFDWRCRTAEDGRTLIREFTAQEEMVVVRTRENDLINWYTSLERITDIEKYQGDYTPPSYIQFS